VKALALDFDGVLFDSAREAFAVALSSFAALRPGSPLARAAAAPEAEPGLYAGFLALLPLGNRAEDYGLALLALERGEEIPDQEAYDAFYAAADPAWLRAFHQRFYRERAAWAARDREGWLARMTPYAGFVETLRRRAGEAVLSIVTAKDRASVQALLAHYGLADLFDLRLVLDKETGIRKRAHLERLATALGLAFKEITFADDKEKHLSDAAPLGVRCALAAWGYNGERERARARARGFLVCTLSDVEAQLWPAVPRAAKLLP
jgi:phosphoglycolate phosphatase-like HAD superfamily hydrolase